MSLLITEQTFEDVETIIEAKGKGQKNEYFIQGVFLQGDIKNRNGRMYPMETLRKEVKRYSRSFIESDRAYGELGHPEGPTINPERISHRIVGLKEEGSNFLGKAKLANTPYGNIAKALIEDGGRLGVSSRGMGSMKTENGVNIVGDDFQLATAADIVIDPSAPAAFVEGIMEDVEWMQLTDGTWMPKFINETKDMIVKAPQDEIESLMLERFETLATHLKGE